MENLPFYIPLAFVITTMLTFFFIAKAFRFSKIIMAVLLTWLMAQYLIAATGFYTHTSTLPPRFLLALLPPLAAIVLLFTTTKGREIIDNAATGTLVLLHSIRVPVELILLMLFIHKTLPGIVTFEGRNFDIAAGITAPLVYYFGFVTKKIKPGLIIAWNILCLLLLANVVITAILSAPFPFQQFAFHQPAIAILYAPYAWLPSFIVPVVLFAHLAILRRMKKQNQVNKANAHNIDVSTL